MKTILFVDDSTSYMVGNNPTDLINRANTELMKFSDWCLANRLTVNTAKTYYMIHTNIITNYLPLPNLSILNEDIFPTDKIKFLGITFDNQFNFKHHISNLSLRISRTIPILLKTKHEDMN